MALNAQFNFNKGLRFPTQDPRPLIRDGRTVLPELFPNRDTSRPAIPGVKIPTTPTFEDAMRDQIKDGHSVLPELFPNRDTSRPLIPGVKIPTTPTFEDTMRDQIVDGHTCFQDRQVQGDQDKFKLLRQQFGAF